MRLSMPTTASLLFVALAAPAAAAPPAEAERPARFIMQPVDGGVVRMDTETGAISMCVKRGTAFGCEPVEDKAVTGKEIERLTKANSDLRADVKRLEDMLELGDKSATEKSVKRHPKFELPSEEDIDKAMNYVERMVKKFRDKLKDIEGGSGKGTQL